MLKLCARLRKTEKDGGFAAIGSFCDRIRLGRTNLFYQHFARVSSSEKAALGSVKTFLGDRENCHR